MKDGKVLVQRESIGEIVLTGVGDLGLYEEQIKCYKPFWCWKVRGWGPNTSNETNYCSIGSEGLLGDDDEDNIGLLCYENLTLIDLDPNKYEYLWAKNTGSANSARIQIFDDVDFSSSNDVIRMTFNLDPSGPSGFAGAAVSVTWNSNSGDMQFSFPVTIAELLSPKCGLVVSPTESIDAEPQDPDNPAEWSPWCRPASGTGMSVNLW